MSMNIDKPLDEIIATNKRANGRRGGRGGAGGGAAQPARVQPQQNAAVGGARARYGGNAPRQNNQAVVHPLPKQQQQSQRAMPLGEKIIVSNLPDDVTEAQIRDLFTATIGPVRSASMAFDSKGKSKGVATIAFHKSIHATQAFNQFNKRLIDGKQAMKVEIIFDPSIVPAAPLTSRLGAAPVAPKPKVNSAPRPVQPQQQAQQTNTHVAGNGNAGRGGRGGRGRGRGGKRGGDRPLPTLESLDAEMSDYQASTSAATVAPAV